VNSILDLQQIRDGKFSLKITRFDLRDLLRGVIQLFKFQFEERNVALLLEIHQEVPQYIVSDEDRLRQILINLLGNAFKFTFEGQVVLRVESECEGYLQFKVTDTGLGIKEEDKQKLFKMYGRLEEENSKAVNKQGIGFGLEISNQLAKLLAEGSDLRGIKVESEFGKGSIFSFLVEDSQATLDHSFKNEDLAFDEPHVFAEEIENISIKISPYSSSLQLASEREIAPRSPHLSNLPSRFSSAQSIVPKRASICDKYSPMSRLGKANGKYGFSSYQPASPNLKWVNVVGYSSSPVHSEVRSDISFLNPTADFSLNKCDLPEEKPRRALIIDDNPFNLLVAKHLVEGMNFTVETALNGKLGVELAKAAYVSHKKPFELVLMDLQMPVMDGYEATKVLREIIAEKEIPDLHIIAVSANDSEDDKRRSKEAGMNGHLAKPLTEKMLREALERVSFGSDEDADDDSSISNSFEKVD